MHALLVFALVVTASVLTLVSTIGVAVMRDPLQRLHFLAPPTTISAPLIAVAAFVDEPNLQAGFKASLVAVLLMLMNGVATHATARAVRVHARGHWEADVDDRARLVRGPPTQSGRTS